MRVEVVDVDGFDGALLSLPGVDTRDDARKKSVFERGSLWIWDVFLA